jgi:hypothetical protein
MTNAHDIGTGFLFGFVASGFVWYHLPVIAGKVHPLDFIAARISQYAAWTARVDRGFKTGVKAYRGPTAKHQTKAVALRRVG